MSNAPEYDAEHVDKILTPEVRNAIKTAASMTAMIGATQETPESFEGFMTGALQAVWKDGRVNAGKATRESVANDPVPDVSDDLAAIAIGVALFNLSVEDSLVGAFMAMFVAGYDSPESLTATKDENSDAS